jgi:hypothetical protein
MASTAAATRTGKVGGGRQVDATGSTEFFDFCSALILTPIVARIYFFG